MKIPILNSQRQYAMLQESIEEVVLKVLRSGQYITAGYDQQLAADFSKIAGTEYALPVHSGTEALHLALAALDLGTEEEVITTPFTFIATAEAISYRAARPVFVDIDPHTYNIDPNKIEAKINSKTRVILPVHLYGLSADMEAINAIAQKHKLKVVEDACQAVAAKDVRGRRCGSLGDIGCFSFYPTKNIGAAGEGGIISTSDPELYEKMKRLRVHGSKVRYYHDEIGYNARLDEIQCAILTVKLKYLDQWTERRRVIATRVIEALKNLPVILPDPALIPRHVFHQLTLRVKNREQVLSKLTEKGIATGIYYPVPLHLQKAYKFLGYQKGDFPVTEQISEEVFSIPCYPELTDDEVDYMIRSLREAL